MVVRKIRNSGLYLYSDVCIALTLPSLYCFSRPYIAVENPCANYKCFSVPAIPQQSYENKGSVFNSEILILIDCLS